MNRLNTWRIITALELNRQSLPPEEIRAKADIDEQIKLLQEPDASFKGDNGLGGKHLAVVREFIKCKAINGDQVIWGSFDHLRLKPLTVYDLERLSTQIAKAVISDFLGTSSE